MQIQTKILTIFCAIIFILMLLILEPGFFTIDEVSYFLMTKSLVEDFSLELKNGFDEYPAWQFHILGGEIVGNKMVGKYPVIYPLICVPFFAVLGIKGFFIINIAAFIAIILMLYSYAFRILQSRNLALATVIIYCFCTFALEYAVAIWPHILSSFFILSSYYILDSYFLNEEKKISIIFLCGILAGVATGIRLQNIITFALIAFILILFSNRRVAALSALSCGPAFIIVTLSIVNYYRFGLPDPFSYGKKSNLGFYYEHPEVIIVTLLCISIIFIMSYFKNTYFLKKKHILLLVAGVITLFFAGIILSSKISDVAYYMSSMFYHNIVTYVGYFNKSYPYNETGGMVFNNILKKALLQSCPYMILAFMAPFVMKKFSYTARSTLTLYTAFLCPLIFTSSFFFSGGFCFNYRYAIDIIPFGVILVMQFLRNARLSWKYFVMPSLVFLLITFILRIFSIWSILSQYIMLYFPLFLAGILFVLTILLLMEYKPKIVSPLFFTFLLTSFFYSSVVCMEVDLPASLRYRKENYDTAIKLDKVINNNSMILMGVKDPLKLMQLKENKNISIGYAPIPEIKTHKDMIDYFLASGKYVYFFSSLQYYSWRPEFYREKIERQLKRFYSYNKMNFPGYNLYQIFPQEHQQD